MPVSANATVTGRTGVGQLISSAAITGIKKITIDIGSSVMSIDFDKGRGPQHLELDFVLTTTLTDTISSLVNTIVVSGS